MAEQIQIVPARHAIATFVPAGQCIKIENTSGTQVVDTWAFALPQPAPKRDLDESTKAKEAAGKRETANAADQVKSKSKTSDLPSQEEAEQATAQAHEQARQQEMQKKGWTSYIPSVPTLGLKKDESSSAKGGDSSETQQQKDSKTWSSYFKPGKGFSSYIPEAATDTVSKFVNVHSRDTNKSYLEQLTAFSKTPVGAAGMSAFTGSGYTGTLYAGYQAWNAKTAADAPAMEYMSMSHTRATTLHMMPQQNDTLVTNLREPILTVIEDKSPGIHDTMIPACDPQRYKGLGVDHWEEHGSCAENLVLALKELNERAGLKGVKAIGADVTINSVPAPLNLFMNIPWTESGDLSFEGPKGKAGDYVRLRAERDVVVVMSACPNDVNGINGEKITDVHFVVEEEDTSSTIKRTLPKKKVVPKMKTGSPNVASAATSPSSSTNKATPKRPPPTSVSSSAKASSQATSAPVAAPPAKKPPPAKTPPKPSPASASGKASPATKPVKKPAPPAVKPQTTSEAATGPVEKKKPRKLVRQPTQS